MAETIDPADVRYGTCQTCEAVCATLYPAYLPRLTWQCSECAP